MRAVLIKGYIEHPMTFVLNVPVLMPEAEQEGRGRLVDLRSGDGIVEGGCDLSRAQVEAA